MKRIINKKLIEEVKRGPCIVSGRRPCDAHHVTPRGAGGGDVEFNLMPLSRAAHMNCHAKGLMRFSEIPRVKEWLLNHGWEISGGRWKHFGSAANLPPVKKESKNVDPDIPAIDSFD